MAPPRKVPPIPSFLSPDDFFRLDGAWTPESRSTLQRYLGSAGTPADWAAVGLPIRFDATGNPLRRMRGYFCATYSLVMREEAATLPRCVDVAAKKK